MALNQVKVKHAITFMKYLARVVSLIFLPKTFIWNKTSFPASDSLNFAELVENELMKSIFKKIFLSNSSLLIVKLLKTYN